MSKVLELVDRTISFSDKYQFDFKDASGYFKAKNKDKAITDLNYLNHTFHGHSIMSFDFKKHYTNLSHDKVIEKTNDLLSCCVKEKNVDFINVSKNLNASWSSKNQPTAGNSLMAILLRCLDIQGVPELTSDCDL